MGLDRYRNNRRGIRELLGREDVRDMLATRAERIATAARRNYRRKPPHTGQVDVFVSSISAELGGRLRARAAVVAQHPGVLHIEADRRPLGSAIDAGRPKPRKPRKKKKKSEGNEDRGDGGD